MRSEPGASAGSVQSDIGVASRPTTARTKSSAAVACIVGWRQRGSRSQIGPSTKPRSAARGCGSSSRFEEHTQRPKAIKSRSSVRGAFRSAGRRPNRASTSCSRRNASSGACSVVSQAAELTKGAPRASGQAAERQTLERLTSVKPSDDKRSSAASRVCRGELSARGKLAPRPTMTPRSICGPMSGMWPMMSFPLCALNLVL